MAPILIRKTKRYLVPSMTVGTKGKMFFVSLLIFTDVIAAVLNDQRILTTKKIKAEAELEVALL